MTVDHHDGVGRPDTSPEDLLGEFESWAADRGLDVDPFVIETALDLLDRVPLRWTAGNLHELMVVGFPRKVTMSASEWPGVVPTLHDWIEFLADRHPTLCGDAATLHAGIDRDTAAFLSAMADERNYGVAKFWTTRMLENGVDTDDETQMQRFLTMVRIGEIDYDGDVLAEIMRRGSFDAEIGAVEFDDADRPLPPVSLPTTDELTTLAASAVLVARLRAFVNWVGTGRAVTATKRLRIADAKALAGLLDVDQPFLARARSSADLPEVSQLVEWARAARLVRVVKNRLVSIKSAAELPDRPLKLWQRAFDAFPRLGPVICLPTGYYVPASQLAELLPEVAPAIWLCLYTAGGTPVPVELLVEITRDFMTEPVFLGAGALLVDIPERLWRRDLASVLAAMRLLGAVELTTSTDPAERARLVELTGDEDPDLTFVRLTPLGLWGVRDALREEGFDVPLIEDLAGEPVDVMCAALEHATPEVTDTVLTAWVAARGADTAAAELAALCVDAHSSSVRLVAVGGLDHAGAAGVAQARRLRSAGGPAGAVATTWLIQHGALDLSDATEQELMLSLVDNFAALHEHHTLIDDMSAHPLDDQISFVRTLADTDHPARADLLDVISTEHPDRAVATAARKANRRRGRPKARRAIGKP
jgi:hypothetical protein